MDFETDIIDFEKGKEHVEQGQNAFNAIMRS